MTKFLAFLIATSHVELGGYLAAACKKQIPIGVVDGNVYVLFVLLVMRLWFGLVIVVDCWSCFVSSNSHSPASAQHP